jgi:hypothetical protein
LRLGGNFGFGLHAGIGYFPGGDGETPVLASAGIKIFPYKGIYINPQFGLTGRKYVSSTYLGLEEKYSWGPSLLFGIDQVFGRKMGIGFNAGLGLTFNFYEDEEQLAQFDRVSPILDMGFIIRF